MAKLLYDYWFVQYDFPMSEAQAASLGRPELAGHPYRSSGGKLVPNKTLNHPIPEDWNAAVVGDVLAKEPKTLKKQTSDYLDKGDFPIIDQSKDYICGYTNNEASVIRGSPKIVFGDHTRILKFINFEFARGADGTQVISSNSPRLPPHLFYQMLIRIDLSSYGYARHFKFLKDHKVVIPGEDIASKYEAVITPMYTLIKSNIQQNQELSALRDWLLPMLMNGQVTVQ